ncbi:uncharacterized protein GLRG_11871 [Colletotrichum graminicola M1.001]|uniref:Zn(2)-C6 fungal-type domain-containing protein n=1 Tax=Colletotrichum graminicola (strain M1.001 / M2 / FGSC 10212) TaxID=645133 RepID=E3R0T4_COLGM|nr:uncharacterized protein GLRG_11871 [Colletotrichum graminicola M1.001]EFQ36722.1 hypothetical protein GLRG_11871 [Colletotrichum graminicola M1.001]
MSESESPDFANAKKFRACTSCARQKIRCRWPPESGNSERTDCLRCSRMSISCRVPDPVPRKKRGKSRQSSRVLELEKKIDGLVNLFQSQQQAQEDHGLKSSATGPEGEARHLSPDNAVTLPGLHQAPSCRTTSSGIPASTPESHIISVPDSRYSDATFYLVPGFSISVAKAEEYLDIYRTRLVTNFPFVPVRHDMTAIELHDTKKFLFWCIMQAVVPQTASVQKAVDDWVRRHAAMHVVVLGEQSIELLQGLLVYVAWGDLHFQMGTNAYSLLQMAIGMVMEMTLFSFGGFMSWMPRSSLPEAWALLGRGNQIESTKQTLEEQRAILGCYFVASSNPAAMRKYSQIQYRPQIARCFKAIREASELPSDAQLLALIRLQNIGDRIRSVYPNTDKDEGIAVPIFREHFAAVLLSIRKEIIALESEEPIINRNQPMLWAHYQALMVKLYEPCIGMRAARPSEATSLTEPHSRTEALWCCLQAVENAAKALLDISVEKFAYLPFNSVADLAFTMTTSHRLLLERAASDWDVGLARQKLDMAELTRQLGDKLEEADNVALVVGQKRRVFEDNSSRWSNYAYRARWLRQLYLSRMAPPVEEQTPSLAQLDSGPIVIIGYDEEWSMSYNSAETGSPAYTLDSVPTLYS